MKSESDQNLMILTGCLCMMLFAGCTNLYRSEKLRVIPYHGEYTAALSADQVVDLLLTGGFSHEEILELGTDLRNALAMDGGAKIRNDQYTKAIFLVQDKQVFMTVRNGRDLLFDLEEEKGRLPSKKAGEKENDHEEESRAGGAGEEKVEAPPPADG